MLCLPQGTAEGDHLSDCGNWNGRWSCELQTDEVHLLQGSAVPLVRRPQRANTVSSANAEDNETVPASSSVLRASLPISVEDFLGLNASGEAKHLAAMENTSVQEVGVMSPLSEKLQHLAKKSNGIESIIFFTILISLVLVLIIALVQVMRGFKQEDGEQGGEPGIEQCTSKGSRGPLKDGGGGISTATLGDVDQEARMRSTGDPLHVLRQTMPAQVSPSMVSVLSLPALVGVSNEGTLNMVSPIRDITSSPNAAFMLRLSRAFQRVGDSGMMAIETMALTTGAGKELLFAEFSTMTKEDGSQWRQAFIFAPAHRLWAQVKETNEGQGRPEDQEFVLTVGPQSQAAAREMMLSGSIFGERSIFSGQNLCATVKSVGSRSIQEITNYRLEIFRGADAALALMLICVGDRITARRSQL